MKLTLSNGYTAQIDDEDLPLVRDFRWYGRCEGPNVYAATSAKGPEGTKGKKIRLHRLIMGAKQGETVDHVNGDTLDNRKANLRIVTTHQNMANVSARSGKFRGVSYSKKDRHWRARIGLSGFRGKGRQCEVHIGCFATAREAAKAWDAVAREWYGCYARLNFPAPSP